MPVVIDVNPGLYEAASRVFGQTIAPGVAELRNQLSSGLTLTSGMAGSDEAGTSWASSYDPAASQTLAVIDSFQAASYKLAGLLEQTGFNHDAAESASDQTRRSAPPPDKTHYDTTMTSAGGYGCQSDTPPSAAGSDSGGGPPGWGTLQHLVGYLWPNGDTGRLRNAANVWNTAATSLDGFAACVPEAVYNIQANKSAEVDDAVNVVTSMEHNFSHTAEVCRALGTACSHLADHIDTAHSQIEGELRSFVEWTAGIEAGGALLSVVSFGGSELVAQGVEGGRIAATAARLAEYCRTLVSLARTVGEAVEQVTTKIASVGSELRAILGARLSAVVTSVVERFPLLARGTEDAERGLATAAETDAKYEAYVARRTAAGKIPKSREVWERMAATANANREAGAAYEASVMRAEGIVKGKDGWDTQVALKTAAGGRRFDIANESDQIAIETKSGSSPTTETLNQLDKDEDAIRQGWQIKWVLKQDLSPKIMQRLQEMSSRYGGDFTYTVGK